MCKMKLNEAQRQGVQQLLSYMSERDILSLARTVTNNFIPFTSVKDAQEAILLHETNLPTFFSRRKITKEILCKYLNDNKIGIPANCDKSQLVSALIEVWKSVLNPIITKPCTDTTPSNTQDHNIGDVDMLAEKFASWFYSILNDYEKMCAEHFWNDCSLHLVMQSQLESVVKDVEKNSESVVSTFRELQEQHKLLFNPNLTHSGVQGKIEAHGIVIVMACGTLHQIDKCVGIFQQAFGLVKDPFMQNNWRIKTTSLILKCEEISGPPSLQQECFEWLPLLK